MSAVRSIDKVTATAWEGNALRRGRDSLLAWGETKSILSGVIVASIFVEVVCAFC